MDTTNNIVRSMEIIPDMSLIMAVYNRPQYVRQSLAGLLRQKRLPANVILADDGSTDESLDDIVAKYRQLLPVPLLRVWHEHNDKGWGKPLIINKAVQSACEFIMFMDSDSVLHPKCIAEHYRYREKGMALKGRNVSMSAAMTQKLIPLQYTGRSKRYDVLSAIHLPFAVIRKRHFLSGRNFAMWKSDFIAANGYDNTFVRIGNEDLDLSVRLRNNGIQIKGIHGQCINKHLWHSLTHYGKDACMEQAEIVSERERLGIKTCPNGYHQVSGVFIFK
jgi:GT2 family glycosyltransferase